MLDDKESIMDVLKGYVEVDDDVGNETSWISMDRKTKIKGIV